MLHLESPFPFALAPNLELLLLFGGDIRVRAADKQLSPIRESDAAAVGPIRTVLGLIALYCEFGSKLQGLLRKASPEHDVRATAFDHPVGHLAVWADHVDVNPGMGIDPFHRRHRSLQMDRLFLIEFRFKCM